MLGIYDQGGDCSGEAPHLCCRGANRKVILQPLLCRERSRERSSVSQRVGETRGRPACQACMCVGLNLKAVIIK